jgi:arsenite methyltransferase
MLTLVGFIASAAVTAIVITLLLTILGFGIHTTRRGKFLVGAEIPDSPQLRGEERVLEVGCGRGAVLTMVAERLSRGRVVRIDIWRRVDQSGNGTESAERN